MANALVSFVMLGIIPGTNIQLTFKDWIFAVIIGTAAFILIIRLRSLLASVLAHIRAARPDTTVIA